MSATSKYPREENLQHLKAAHVPRSKVFSRETFLEELADIYDAEKQLVKALPKLDKSVKNADLKEGIENHLKETEGHVKGAERVFEIMGETSKGQKCKAMEGLIAETKELIEEDAGDAALICAAQKVEHYEIAAYGSLKVWAEKMGQDEAVEVLEETLQEEEAADEKLTEVAEEAVNAEEEESEEKEHAKSR